MKSKNKFLVVVAMCIAIMLSFGIALFFDASQKVYADETYFMAVEKYELPVVDGVPDVQSILQSYHSVTDTEFEEVYIYDSVNGNTIIEDDFSIITAENWTNIFVKIDGVDINIIDFLREIANKQICQNVNLVQTLATNQANVETNNIAMLNTASEQNCKQFVAVSFLPNGLHAKLSVDVDKTDSSKIIYDWSYIGTNKNFQTLSVNASLNNVSIKAQTQYQSLTSTKKYYAFATELSNIEGADKSEPYKKFEAQGHYVFQFGFTDQNGAGSSIKPTTEFWLLDENYYLDSNVDEQIINVAPKLWNVQVTKNREADSDNEKKNRKEFSIFGYNNANNYVLDGDDKVYNNKGDNPINYPTISYDPSRYQLCYYFVDRSLDSGALQIVTSQLKYVDNKLCVELSNGKLFEVTSKNISAEQYGNKTYGVDVVFEDLGHYVLQFDFALNKIDDQTQEITNFLPNGAIQKNNTLERSDNWNQVRTEQYLVVGTDDLTIFGYQLYYSTYNENGNGIDELKSVNNQLYADVTNANSETLEGLYNDYKNDNDWDAYINGVENIDAAVYDENKIPSTNQPPLFFRYSENQTLKSIIVKRYDNKINKNWKETKSVDNIYRFSSTGIESQDNGYYEVFVTYEFKTEQQDKIYTQIFAFEVKYSSPKIEFKTIDEQENENTWAAIGFTNKTVKIDWSASLPQNNPFEIEPNVKFNVSDESNLNVATINPEGNGIAKLSVKNNAYATFAVTIEWGPINASRPSKTYKFTIDKTNISDFVKIYQNEDGNDAEFDGLITKNSVRILYGQELSATEKPKNYKKKSGANISLTYSLLQMSAGESVELVGVDAIKNGYKVASKLENNVYEPYGTNGYVNYLPNVNAIFVLNFVDDAGNQYVKYIIIDNTAPKMMYRVANENGEFDAQNNDWNELTYANNSIKANAQVNYGKYKAILINGGLNIEIPTTNEAQIKTINEQKYLLVKISNDKQYEIFEAKVENQKTYDNISVSDVVGNISTGKLIVNFDEINLNGILSGYYPNNIQNIGDLEGYGTRGQNHSETILGSNEIGTQQYLRFEWKNLSQNYVVEKLEYEFYAFDFSSDPTTNENYPFAKQATKSGVIYSNGNQIKTISKDNVTYNQTENINISTGNREFSGGNASMQGLYVVTRTYNHEQFKNAIIQKQQDGKIEYDTEVKKYYFYIDRNNIIAQSSDGRLLTSAISLTLGGKEGQTTTTFGGLQFLEDILDIDGNILKTNKQPITINVPTQKYKVAGVTFEGFDYLYDEESGNYQKTQYKLFFMPNEYYRYTNGTLLVQKNGQPNEFVGTYQMLNNQQLELSFNGQEIVANLPNGTDVGDSNCTNLNFEIDKKQIFAKRYTQNMLYYQYQINNAQASQTQSGETNPPINNALGATNTNYVYKLYVSDINSNYVGANTSSEYAFENNTNNALIFKFEVNLSKPNAWWQDAYGFETTNNQNTTDVKLIWNRYTSENSEFFANINPQNISIKKHQYSNGQIVSYNLGTFTADSTLKNAFVELSNIVDTTESAKYEFVLKYYNSENYYDFGQETKTLYLDTDAPYFNFAQLFYNDTFLQQLTAKEIAEFGDYTKAINFENYAFVVNENWKLKIPTAQDVYKTDSKIAYDKLFVSSEDNFDLYDIAEAWYRPYDKQYSGTNPEHLQSIVPGDSRYKQSVPNYKFDPNLTRIESDETVKVYRQYDLEYGTTLPAGSYYEIIEKDIAGNYRVYTIYVTSEEARTINFEIDENHSITTKSEGTYILDAKTAQDELHQSTINLFDQTELNSFVTSPLSIKEINGLGVYYDVTIKNLATNGQTITIRSANSNIIAQINAAIYNNFSYGKNGNNFEIKFFAASGTYTLNYRTQSQLAVLFNNSTSTLTFTVDKSVGSYIKSLQVLQDGTSVFELDRITSNDAYTLTTTTANGKTTYMLKFDIAQNFGTQIKYVFVDNFENTVQAFKVIGIENTNFAFDPNDTTGSNMLIFGNGTSAEKNYDEIEKEQIVSDTIDLSQFTHIAEFYTGANTVTFRYQTKVYSNVKIFEINQGELKLRKNLPSYTSSTTYKNTTQIYSDNNQNVDNVYLITFIDPVGNYYAYIIHHYTILAEISFESETVDESGNPIKIDFDEPTIPQLSDPITIDIVPDETEKYPTIITAKRTYESNGIKQIENLGTIQSGYIFNKSGTYEVTASNGIGLSKKFMFTYVESDYSLYTVTATSQDGLTRILKPSDTIKYNNNGNMIDQYFALKSETIQITVGKNYDTNDTTIPSDNFNATTHIYTITNTKIDYSKSIAITQIKSTTDLFAGKKMLIDETPIGANAISMQSLSKIVTLTIPDSYGDKNNKLVVNAKFNGANLGEINGIEIETQNGFYRTFSFEVAGEYTISINDQAGNVHLFNGTTQNFELSVLNNVIYRINGKEPIKNSYHNDPVILNVINIKKFYADKNQPYVTEVVQLNGNVIDNKQYSKVDNGSYYTYTFDKYGSYDVTFTAYVNSISEQNKIVTSATFTIINQNQARNMHEYIGLNGYQITSIVKDNADITNLIKQQSGNAVLNQFAIVGGTGDNVIGGNGRYTITVNAYLGNLIGYQSFTYNVWINDDTTALIESNVQPGSATTKTIYLQLNLYQIYSKIGECKVKLNGKTYITINGNTASENKISTYQLTNNQTYNVTVETDNGNTVLSFVLTKKEPLNTVAIIVIVTVSVVGSALAVTFVVLRKRMRVR